MTVTWLSVVSTIIQSELDLKCLTIWSVRGCLSVKTRWCTMLHRKKWRERDSGVFQVNLSLSLKCLIPVCLCLMMVLALYVPHFKLSQPRKKCDNCPSSWTEEIIDTPDTIDPRSWSSSPKQTKHPSSSLQNSILNIKEFSWNWLVERTIEDHFPC